jgi:hypothetical protein
MGGKTAEVNFNLTKNLKTGGVASEMWLLQWPFPRQPLGSPVLSSRPYVRATVMAFTSVYNKPQAPASFIFLMTLSNPAL